MTDATTTTTFGCLPKVVATWGSFVSSSLRPNGGRRVHPAEPTSASDGAEFVQIDSRCRIRVIRAQPGRRPAQHQQQQKQQVVVVGQSKRCSLSEEYWFMKWNKPFRIRDCNCSFRRSLRYSATTTPSGAGAGARTPEKNVESILSLDLPPTKITNLGTFVERLIQETYFEALHEYYMLKTKEAGVVNLAYKPSEDDHVVLRKKSKSNVITAPPNKRKENGDDHNAKIHCVHKINQKPLVILFHGIGLSADVWSSVINALVIKGYEVIAPDMLGHGFSSAPSKSNYYTFNNLLLQALTIFDHYMTDTKRKSILIGHSYGCSLVTAMYPLRAQLVSQLILISGGGPTPLAPPVKEKEMPAFGCIYMMLHPLFYCGLKRSLFYSSRGKHFKTCEDISGLPRHVMENITNGQKWSEGDAAFHRRILIPTLLVHGLQDKHITLVQECEMERTIPRAFLELIPNAGHVSISETPEHLIHMILCFIEMWN